MSESKGEMKSLLMKVKEASGKSWLETQLSKVKIIDSIWFHYFMASRQGNSDRLLFSRAPKSLQMVTAAMKLEDAYSLEGKL